MHMRERYARQKVWPLLRQFCRFLKVKFFSQNLYQQLTFFSLLKWIFFSLLQRYVANLLST